MALTLSLLLQGVSLGFTAAVSPGPFLAYLISETLARGWRHTLPILLAPLLSDGPVILVTVFILGELPDWALRTIQLVGGLFILYLAWSTARWLHRNTTISLVSDQVPQAQNIVLRAATINILSPSVWIFWSTINGPILVRTWHDSPPAAIVFVLGFYGLLLSVTGGWIAVFQQLRRLDERIIRALLTVNVIVLAGFGLFLLKSALFV